MAIALDATSTKNEANGTSISNNHTCTGSDLALVVLAWTSSGSDDVTSVTYNGVAMTQVDKLSDGSGSMYMYLLLNPATGTHSITVNTSGATFISFGGASYTGVKQTAQPDAHDTKTTGASTSFTLPLTTVANNCWVIGGAWHNGFAITVGTDTVQRSQPDSHITLADSDAAEPIGSFTLNFSTGSSTGNWKGLVLSLAPVVPPSAIKNINGLAY
jgi:hypothetical protein